MSNNSFANNSSTSPKSYFSAHKKLIIILATVLFILVAIPVFIAAWLGFVPVLSDIMGSSKARDLGVQYSEKDLATYKQKANILIKDYSQAPPDPQNPTEKAVLAKPVSAQNIEFTQEELSAAINDADLTWMPVKNTQIRFTNGTVEISGNIDPEGINRLQEMAANNGSSQEAKDTLSWTNRLSNDAPFYAKANANISNNVLTLSLVKAEIGRLSIPLSVFGDSLTNGTEIKINSDEFSVNSASLTEGKLNFSGTYPTEIYLEQ